MREIKFRIRLKALSHVNGYDKGCELTIYNEIFKRENGISFWSIEQEWEILSKDQFTGLTDKNGKEIYESDVYHQGYPNITYTVVYKGSTFMGKQNGSSSYAGLEYWQDRIEVIGNIHENPELL